MEIVGSGNEWSWEANVTACAERLSQKWEEAWVFEMKKGAVFLPDEKLMAEEEKKTGISVQQQTEQNRIRQLQVMIDYAVGTNIALLTHYASLDKGFEKHILKVVKDKFARLRTMGEMNK